VNSVFRRFIDELPEAAQFPSLRLIIIGGEAAHLGDVERYRRHFADECRLLNTLGCTELPTYRYFVMDKRTELPGGVVPAGHAVPGIETILIDADGSQLLTSA
jgi:acyl-coenzyme A synthetase/AMP-(fatty) acid ligase